MYRLWWATVFVADVERAAVFYRDTLGLQERFVSEGYASFRVGPALLELSEGPGPVGVPTGIGIGVPNLDEACERLVASGVTIVQPPTKKPWGDYDAIIEDPDGNQITLDHMPADLTEEYLDGR